MVQINQRVYGAKSRLILTEAKWIYIQKCKNSLVFFQQIKIFMV